LEFSFSSCWKCDHSILQQTPWSRVLLEKLIKTLSQEIPHFNSFTKVCHRSLNQTKQSAPFCPI
jgi:hypothetical protein